MDGMNFSGRDWRPDGDEGQGVPANPGHHAIGALALFVVIVLTTFAGIIVLDRLGVPRSVPEVSAGP